MHTTNAGEKRKALQRDARGLEREARILKKIGRMSSDAKIRQDEANSLKAEALALKMDARLEDLHLWQMEKIKTSKRGSRKYAYWMASWREGGRTRNVHLGSCKRVSEEAALQKARAMKAEALGQKAGLPALPFTILRF